MAPFKALQGACPTHAFDETTFILFTFPELRKIQPRANLHHTSGHIPHLRWGGTLLEAIPHILTNKPPHPQIMIFMAEVMVAIAATLKTKTQHQLKATGYDIIG